MSPSQIACTLSNQAVSFAWSKIFGKRPEWTFVGDGAGWSIDHDGNRTLSVLRANGVNTASVNLPFLINSQVVHFGQLNTFMPRHEWRMVSAEHVVATCFHGDYGISSAMSRKLDLLLKYSDEVDRLILSNSTMFQRFKEWGFPAERMRLISVGVDLELFTPVNDDLREFARSRLGIPQGAVVIGSFQKDGNGWGEGLEPKFVKGPDIFCDVLEVLGRDLPLHVLLTGPARGYVKQRLLRSGITFTHHLLKSSDDLPSYYHACDCYLMCSREEGGPKSVPEAMACGIPLVATRTGLARDVEVNCGVGWFADVGDVIELVRLTREALCDKEKRHDYFLLSKKHASTFSWENIGKSHLNILHELI